MKCVRLSVIAVWILHLRDTWVSRYNQSGEEILWTKKRVQFDDLLFTIEGMPLQQTEICITVRRRSWQLLHLCAVHTAHNSSHLADCISSSSHCTSVMLITIWSKWVGDFVEMLVINPISAGILNDDWWGGMIQPTPLRSPKINVKKWIWKYKEIYYLEPLVQAKSVSLGITIGANFLFFLVYILSSFWGAWYCMCAIVLMIETGSHSSVVLVNLYIPKIPWSTVL